MPYSVPGVVAPPPMTSPMSPTSRPSHRRSYTFAVDDPRAGPGAFASLGILPRRTRSHIHSPPASSSTPSTPRKFHFRGDANDDDSSSSSDEPPAPAPVDDDDGPPPPLRLRQPPAFRLTPATGSRASPPRSPQRSPNSSFVNAVHPTLNLSAPVPFPRASNSPSSPISPSFASAQNSPGFPTRPPGPARTASTPVILLSNGKPLKSSLKSSSSAPQMPSHHLRARSAPSTPSLGSAPAPTWSDEALRPACECILSYWDGRGDGDGDGDGFEFDDEVEWGIGGSGSGSGSGSAKVNGHGYPFPKVTRSPLNPHAQEKEWRYALEAPGVPRVPEAGCMVLLEGMWLEGVGCVGDSSRPASSTSNVGTSPSSTPSPSEGELTLHGTLLARNAAFEKHVFVRFTLDGWCTTSEVGARYVEPAASPFAANWGSNENKANGSANSAIPTDGLIARQGEQEEPGPGWDRFAFSIRLADYAHSHAHSRAQTNSTPRLRETGVGGIGRGLEGRELVLVGRFFAPWVRPGGVGPYVWCDTLPPSLTSPGTQAGVDVSPSGRPWIGTGGGGAGEWWDNNGGRDYRVGFRCVAMAEDPPAAVPASAPTATQGQAQAQATGGIPFPSAESSSTPSSSTSAPSDPSSSPSQNPGPPPALSLPSLPPFPAQTLPIPPPPPPRTAHAQALAAKLGRLSLRNYAAPRTVSLPSGATPVVPVGLRSEPVVGEKVDAASGEKADGDKAEAKDEKDSETTKDNEGKAQEEKQLQPAPGTQSSGGVGLYWPWGRGVGAAVVAPAVVTNSTSASTSLATSNSTSASTLPATQAAPAAQKEQAQDDDDDSSSDDDAASSLLASSTASLAAGRRGEDGEGEETPPTSPLGAGGLLPVLEGLVSQSSKESKELIEEKDGDMDMEVDDEATPTNEKEEWKVKPTEVPLPVSPPSSSPGTNSPPTTSTSTSTSTSPSPLLPTTPLLPSAADASSSLYKAFVRQWCFAGASGGNGTNGNGAKVVGV
ncbi:hypothetical protein B0H13DRAFT_2525341 [Mycena leptocephala]|nr:hypothetical protein B0H13DRAFT_2525341 [Mycena leptocephala]